MALTKTNSDVVDIPDISEALVADNSVTGIKTYINNLFASKADIDSPIFIGTPKVPTAAPGDNDTQIASTAFVQAAVSSVTNTVPTFTGGVGGNDGGEIHIAKAPDGSLAGDVVIDVFSNNIRIFQNASPWKGYYIDLAAGGNNIGTNLGGQAIPSGTRMLFAQGSAPTGWVQQTGDDANNRLLRVVANANGDGSGSAMWGNYYAGSDNPIYMDKVPWHQHSFSTGTESANHSHAISAYLDIAGSHNHNVAGTGWGSNAGSNAGVNSGQSVETDWQGNHNHGIHGSVGAEDTAHSHSGTTNGNNGYSAWAPRYLNLILCQKS